MMRNVPRSSHPPSPCLRTFSYFFAEMLRKSGYPDWMQLAALIHEIGRVVYFLDTESAAEANVSSK